MTRYRKCSGCHREQLIEGGCELSYGRWLCAACWVRYVNRRARA